MKKIQGELIGKIKRRYSGVFIIIICKLFFICNILSVHANVGDIGHWKDSTGGQIPGTTFGGFNFNSEIRNDGIYTKPNDSTIEVTESGDYLIIATTHDEDTSNGRYNSQLTISQTAGTGDIFSSHYTGFSRDNSENESWTRGVGIIVGATANSQFQVQKRRDTDAPTGGSVISSSDLQIVKLNQSNYGIYDIGGTGNAYGGTTPNTVDITNISNESNTASIEGNTTNNTITIKGDNKTYLIAWSVSFDSGSSRTQRIGHLDYDNVNSLSTRSYCYNRNATNEYCGLGSMDIIRTSTTDINLKTEVYIGDGILADEGGADIDGTITTDGNGQIIILEMPDYLEVFNSEDSIGLQDITSAQTLNIARDVKINDTGSFTKASDTTINVTSPSDIFSWANVWTARSDVSSGARQTSYGSIVIDGVEQTIGRHGNYSRGNQSTQDTFAMSFHPAGIFATSGAGATIGVNSDPLAGGETGGGDRTQAGTLGFFAINLDTLTPPATEPILGITYNDNDADNIVETNQVVKYSVDIENTGTDATGITALAQIDSNFGTPYGFIYGNCGNPSESFTDPNLNFSNISILGGYTCNIEYYVQVDSGVTDGTTITSNIDVSNAIEGGNNPAIINGENLTVQACGVVNDVNIEFVTDNWGYETFWSLTPNGNVCGVGEIANGGNTTQVNCTSGGDGVASAGNGYAINSTINEGPFSLTVGNQYDIHVVDDFGDGITTSPDVTIYQNGGSTDTFEVDGNGGVFTFTVQNSPSCADNTNPEVSINQANSQSDPTTIDNITYSVIFNEPINTGTFTSADISINGTTGTISSGPTEVTPFNGTSFEFIVNGMTQFDIVTATIPAGGIEDTSGNTNNISTSNDNQITYNGVPSSPGGVGGGMQIWLKADKGTSTTINGANLTTWNDQSGNGYNAAGGVSPTYLDNTTDNLNFNPVVEFDGTTYLENLNNGAYSHSYFAVVVPNNTVNGTLTGETPFSFECDATYINTGTCGLPFGGLILGAFTAAINDEIITHALGSSTGRRSAEIGSASFQAGIPMLINMNENASGTGTEIAEKGMLLNNYNANTYQTLSGTDYRLGRSMDPANPFPYDGKIAEIINYNSRIGLSDKEKIESYLALKYGITLENGTMDYVNSAGTSFWNTITAGTYINNIFGIARDDNSELSQIKSKSSNIDSILTIEAIGEGSNLSPSFNDISDLESLTISNNGLGNVWSTTDSPSGYYILERKWKSQETGETGTINLDFDVDLGNFNIPPLSVGTEYYFIYDSDNDGNLSDETPQVLTNTSGSIWQISGIDIDHNRIFTLATVASTNNLPTDISLSNNSINENVVAGTNIGNLSTTDADSGDTHTYTFVAGSGDEDNQYMNIVGNTLSIIHSPDYEIKQTYNLRIQTDDGNGGQYQKNFIISINNLGETIPSSLDFENPLDDYKYTNTSGNWSRTTTNPYEGLYSLESDNAGVANTQSCFEMNNTLTQVGTIGFYYNVSSQLNGDYLRFYIDNVEEQAWSGTVPWTQYEKTDVPAGSHVYKWCYIKDGATNTGTDNAYIDFVAAKPTTSESNPPIISSINYASGKLLPGGVHNIIIDYNDSESGINISSDIIELYKWDGISSWGSDISASGLNLGGKTITSTTATYPTNNLSFGKYSYLFYISDLDGNTSSTGAVFYIDEPELIISSGSLDIGKINPEITKFSTGELDITVKTVGAGFDLILNKASPLLNGSIEIIDWNTTEGVGYDKNPYTSTINIINLNEIINSQIKNINTNGEKNTYIYSIKLGALVNKEQAAGNYSSSINFTISLDY